MNRIFLFSAAVALTAVMSVGDVQADGGQDGWGVFGPAASTQIAGPRGPIVGTLPAGPRFGFRRNFRRGFGNGYWPAWNDFYNPNSFNRPENQPYFAMNPPVYYNDVIVPRPMGISPFPAPPGVTPVEMTLTPQSETVVNPYFQRKDQPVAGESADEQKEDNDT